MNVSLTPELETFVSNKVLSGRYTSASEVIREALRLLEEQDQDRAAQLAAFNQELKRRIEAADRGEFITAEEFEARLKRKLDAFRDATRA